VTRHAALLAAACLCATLACRHGAGPREGARAAAAVVRELVTPAGRGRRRASSTEDRQVLLSWVEPERRPPRPSLRRAREGGLWSAAHGRRGASWFVNWADFPHLSALADGTLFAHWLEKRSGGTTYDYDVRVSRSRDLGRSWDAPFTPYRDDSAGEHGFVSFAPLDATRMGVLFLDGREAKQKNGAMTLRFAAVTRDAAPEPDTRLDERVCDCCQTALVRTTRGLVAAYRDRSPGEVRDVAVVRFADGRWSEPVSPGAEGWQIHACPVNGPALAAAGDRVALAWFTMASETPRVKIALSDDAGASWGPPRVVDDGHPIGRVDLAFEARGGAAVVSWLEQTDAGASIRLRRFDAGGAESASVSLAGTSTSRSSGFPRIAVADGELLVAWRDASEPARLKTALVELP
jgi:hypothetical protein